MTQAVSDKKTSLNQEWWRGAVIYQIYPRSYFDSNADGIGDIPGITRKLPFIANLGVDAIWLSPFFTSPMKDFGYDVSDYCDVDPMFGTLDDFKTMLKTAHDLGLKVVIDQVYSHTSDQHAWFKESRANRTNAKRDWYVWADAKADGTAPNNWLSIFGGSAWQWDSRRQQYFLHNFLTSQPDLNLHNPEVQEAVLDAARFWLDLGVDGFRLDVVNFFFHDQALTDNPAVSKPEEKFVGVGDDNPFSRQFHKHQLTQPENLKFLARLRAVMDQYEDRFTVGEIGAPEGLKVMAEYTAGGDKLHSAYTFELLGDQYDPPYIRSVMQSIEKHLNDGWPCFALSNHDVARSVSRWNPEGVFGQDEFAKTSLSLLFSLRGSACLYQGEELGFEQAEVPFDKLQDPYGIEFWPEYKGRDGCRTPIAWNEQGGFSEAEESWLPVFDGHKARSAETQEGQADSVLSFVKAFLHWRKQHPALLYGDIVWHSGTLSGNGTAANNNVLSFERRWDNRSLFVAINLTNETQTLSLPGKLDQLADDHGLAGEINDNEVTLPPLGGVYAYITP